MPRAAAAAVRRGSPPLRRRSRHTARPRARAQAYSPLWPLCVKQAYRTKKAVGPTRTTSGVQPSGAVDEVQPGAVRYDNLTFL